MVQSNCRPSPRYDTTHRETFELPPPPSEGITIEFPFSTSQALDFAIREAQKQISFVKFGDGRKAVYRVTYHPFQMPAVLDLIEYLKGRRLRTVYVDGEKVPWKSVFQFAWCLEKKKSSLRPEYYCLGYDHRERFINFWGCIHSGLYLFPYAPWHSWGKIVDENGAWRFNKKRFKEEIQRNLYLYRFCPELDLTLVNDLIDAFPDQVNPGRDKEWEYVETWGISTFMPVLEIPRRYPSTISGVRPRGLGFLKEMARRVKRRIPWLTKNTQIRGGKRI